MYLWLITHAHVYKQHRRIQAVTRASCMLARKNIMCIHVRTHIIYCISIHRHMLRHKHTHLLTLVPISIHSIYQMHYTAYIDSFQAHPCNPTSSSISWWFKWPGLLVSKATQSFIKEDFSKRLLMDDDTPKAAAVQRLLHFEPCQISGFFGQENILERQAVAHKRWLLYFAEMYDFTKTSQCAFKSTRYCAQVDDRHDAIDCIHTDSRGIWGSKKTRRQGL